MTYIFLIVVDLNPAIVASENYTFQSKNNNFKIFVEKFRSKLAHCHSKPSYFYSKLSAFLLETGQNRADLKPYVVTLYNIVYVILNILSPSLLVLQK